MGNQGAKEFTFAREGDEFIQTGDGVKLSSSLVRSMTIENEEIERDSTVSEVSPDKNSSLDTTKLAKEYQSLLDEREKEISRLIEKGKIDLENERAKNDMFYQLTIDEFTKAANDVEQQFIKPTLKPVCEHLQTTLLDCYKKNPKKILDCSLDVKNFQDCVAYTKEAIFKNDADIKD